MGQTQQEIKIVCSLSSHNSPRDVMHQAIYDNLIDEIDSLLAKPVYKEIQAWRT